MIRAEFVLQRHVARFVARCVVCPHEFASHDRGAARSAHEHEWEAARGIRAGWPDTEIALDGGRTFRCELKAPGVKLRVGSPQDRLVSRLNALGHPSSWANSVARYGAECEEYGIPLTENWRTIAKVCDEQVAAEIATRKAKQAAAPKKQRTGQSRSKWQFRRGRVLPAQFARIQAARKPQ